MKGITPTHFALQGDARSVAIRLLGWIYRHVLPQRRRPKRWGGEGSGCRVPDDLLAARVSNYLAKGLFGFIYG